MSSLTVLAGLGGRGGGGATPPGATALAERLAALLPAALAELCAMPARVDVADVRGGRIDDLAIGPALVLAVFRSEPAGIDSVVVADADFVAVAPAALLGGERAAAGRRPSGLELAMIERLFDAVLKALTAAFSTAPPPPRFRLGALTMVDEGRKPGGGPAALVRLRLTFATGEGGLTLALPEPLLAPLVAARPAGPATDLGWRDAIAARLLGCRLELDATLADERLPLRTLERLAPGSLLRLRTRPADAVMLSVGGVAIGGGPLADVAGQAAIQWRG